MGGPGSGYHGPHQKPFQCLVCTRLSPAELAVLDETLADPTRWPKNIWGAIKPPAGMLPGNYRQFGAVATGLWWVREHGHDDIRRASIQRHYSKHVTPRPVEPAALVEAGVIPAGQAMPPPSGPPVDPKRFLVYYAEGVEVGIAALRAIGRQLARYEPDSGDPLAGKEPPLSLLRIAADLGKGVAISQATIRAAGKHLHDEDDDDDFRLQPGGVEPVHIGHNRMRLVEGEVRAVIDEGRTDRREYNERAAMEGAPRLPA